jgi:hypothetical protein
MDLVRHRSIARLAAFAMAFAALLPLLASARMLATDAEVHHCHRLNVDSVVDTDPAAPEGPSQPRKVSCPFCSPAMAAAPPVTAALLPHFIPLDAGVRAAFRASEAPVGTEVQLPSSRAPPAAGCAPPALPHP